MRNELHLLRLFHRLVGWRLFLLVVILLGASIFEGLGLSLFIPILEGADQSSQMGAIITSAIDSAGVEPSLINMLVTMVVFFAVRSAFLIFQRLYVARLTSTLLVELRCQLVERIFKSDYQFLIKKDVGYLNNAVVVEYNGVAFAFEQLVEVLMAVVFALVLLGLALFISPLITGIVFLAGAPILIFVRHVNIRTKNYSIENSSQFAQLQGLLIQALYHFKYLKSTSSYGNVIGAIYKTSKRLGEIRYKLAIYQAITEHGFAPVTILIVAGLLFYQVQILGGEVIEILFLLFVLKRAMDHMLGIQQKYRKFVASLGSVYVYENLEKEVAENQEDTHPEGEVPDFNQAIKIKNVSFKYGSGEYVLKNVDLEIQPRTTVAFVGASGAGKSTMAMLLTALLPPTTGEVLIGDKSYESVDRERLRRGIGYVSQESVIFNDSVGNNIALWDEDATESRLDASSKKAHIFEFIKALPERYDSLLGDNGINISGGQRQRISIARELYKDVDLLILDEATSSLDTASEVEIQRNIDEFRGEKTIVIIAHRMSTVRSCDVIFVLCEGEIVESGGFEELYARGGEFTRMVDLQDMSATEISGAALSKQSH